MVSLKYESDLHRRLSNYLVQRYKKLLFYIQAVTVLYCAGRLVIDYVEKEWLNLNDGVVIIVAMATPRR